MSAPLRCYCGRLGLFDVDTVREVTIRIATVYRECGRREGTVRTTIGEAVRSTFLHGADLCDDPDGLRARPNRRARDVAQLAPLAGEALDT